MKLGRAKPKSLGGVPISMDTGVNLAKAARDLALRRFVESGERERREDICSKCPQFDIKRNRCRECGCFMRAKTTLRSSHCPIGKW